MKRMIMLLAALMVFVACDTEEEPAIDYSTWTTEELLADPNGIDYLVKTAGEVDYDALNEQLKTWVLVGPDSHDWFECNDDKWQQVEMDGGSVVFYVVMEDGTYRECYEPEADPEMGRGFIEWPLSDNPVVTFINASAPGAKILAVVGRTLIVERSAKVTMRVLYELSDRRDWVLETYTRDWKKEYEENEGAKR